MTQSESQLKSSKYILIGAEYADILGGPLEERGFSPIYIPDNPDISNNLRGHADMSVFYDGRDDLFLSDHLIGSELSKFLLNFGKNVHYLDYRQQKNYPLDVPLNVRLCGERFIFNPRTADKALTGHLTNDLGLIPVKCRQGYAACCTMYLKGESIITSDDGIYNSAEGYFSDITKISSGYIALEGFDYGFIGGCVFTDTDHSTGEAVYFTGTLDNHPDRDLILRKITDLGMKPVFLTERPVFDIGGAIVLRP